MQDNNAITEFCKEFEKPDPKANKNYAKLHELLQAHRQGSRPRAR